MYLHRPMLAAVVEHVAAFTHGAGMVSESTGVWEGGCGQERGFPSHTVYLITSLRGRRLKAKVGGILRARPLLSG